MVPAGSNYTEHLLSTGAERAGKCRNCEKTDVEAPAYHRLPNVTQAVCWTHARRKFDEAVKSQPKGKAGNGSASQGVGPVPALCFRHRVRTRKQP